MTLEKLAKWEEFQNSFNQQLEVTNITLFFIMLFAIGFFVLGIYLMILHHRYH